MTLDPAFLTLPLAHRALHWTGRGRPENSRAAVQAAVAAGYGIEIDLQLSADGQAMVFHDYRLARMTGKPGVIRQRTAAELAEMPLVGGDEGVPRLGEVFALVAGRVPVLVELKDQDGAMGDNLGPLEQAVAAASRKYSGPLALMSFNPNSVARLAKLAPEIPRGLTTSAFEAERWPLSANRRAELAEIGDVARVGASFISHDHAALDMPRVAELSAAGMPILCWTVRSPQQEAAARKIACNITFEGYAAALPA